MALAVKDKEMIWYIIIGGLIVAIVGAVVLLGLARLFKRA